MADKNKRDSDELDDDAVAAVTETDEVAEVDEADEWTDGAVKDPDEDF